ncbi:glycerophosphodiester phosphodiesterase [Bifidobacterium pullorum]|nr:glycerophosphodiester phosphodiesterase [Bifidobacterium pullorum]
MAVEEARQPKVITVNLDMFGKDAAAKTAAANKVAKSFGISDETLAQVEDFKEQLTKHHAWDLPFMGYVNEDGYGYAYVPDAAICHTPYWDAHAAFKALPEDAQTAFAIRMLFTHRPVDRYGADMFLHYERGFVVKWEGTGANQY